MRIIKDRRKARQAAEPRSNLSKDKVVQAALTLIDRDGIEAFSVRAVAKALDVFPTAIYWHVQSRNRLLGDVVALVLHDLAPRGTPSSWQAWIRDLFVRYREIIRRHPNVAPLIGVQLVSNPSVDFTLVEDILTQLTQAGFTGKRLVAGFNVVLGGMVGFTTQEFALVPADDTETWEATIRANIAGLDATRFPLVSKHLGAMTNRAFVLRWENGVKAPLDDGFNLFVDSLIAGLDVMAKDARARR